MSNSDQAQKSALVPQHKRMAQGEQVGTSMPSNGNNKPQQGGLSQAKKK
jgi:hypothetical protein